MGGKTRGVFVQSSRSVLLRKFFQMGEKLSLKVVLDS
jgi:hypothetical protein